MVGLCFRFMFHLLLNPVVFLNRPDSVGVGTPCFVARHAVDRKHLALRALDSRFVLLNFGSDPLDLIPANNVTAGMNCTVRFDTMDSIVAEFAGMSIGFPF